MKIVPMEVTYIDHMGNDVNVVNAARVSFDKQVEEFSAKDAKLINYLAEHDHWSPLAHTSISIRIKAPMFLAAQFKKHQVGLVWNEVSRRYVSSEPEFYWPDVWHNKPDNVKQGSADDVNKWFDSPTSITNPITPNTYALSYIESLVILYNEMIENGVAPEEARMILPQCTMTQWIWTGSAMAFARVIKQRKESNAQKAANQLACMIEDVVRPCYPATFNALLGIKE